MERSTWRRRRAAIAIMVLSLVGLGVGTAHSTVAKSSPFSLSLDRDKVYGGPNADRTIGASVYDNNPWPVAIKVYVTITSTHYHKGGRALPQGNHFEYDTDLVPQYPGTETAQVTAKVVWGPKYKNVTHLPTSGKTTVEITNATPGPGGYATASPAPTPGYEEPSLKVIPVVTTGSPRGLDVELQISAVTPPVVRQAHAWLWSQHYGWNGDVPWVDTCHCFRTDVRLLLKTHRPEQATVVAMVSAVDAQSKQPWRLEGQVTIPSG